MLTLKKRGCKVPSFEALRSLDSYIKEHIALCLRSSMFKKVMAYSKISLLTGCYWEKQKGMVHKKG
jgi:hypothetical protein